MNWQKPMEGRNDIGITPDLKTHQTYKNMCPKNLITVICVKA